MKYENLTQKFREIYAINYDIEEALSALKEIGASQMESLKIIKNELGKSLMEADQIILNSQAWKGVRNQTIDFRNRFGEFLEEQE